MPECRFAELVLSGLGAGELYGWLGHLANLSAPLKEAPAAGRVSRFRFAGLAGRKRNDFNCIA